MSKNSVQPPVVNSQEYTIALIGNPNTGKTSVFNSLTGLRQKVSNYAGVTVEKKEGIFFSSKGRKLKILDLPGLYSLIPKSLDDKISSDILSGRYEDENINIDLIVVIADAGNLSRNLYLLTQVLDYEKPVIFALNMYDTLKKKGKEIDIEQLSNQLDVPVIPMIANKGKGVTELKDEIEKALSEKYCSGKTLHINSEFQEAIEPLSEWLIKNINYSKRLADAQAVRLISSKAASENSDYGKNDALQKLMTESREKVSANGLPAHMLEAKFRYSWIDKIIKESVSQNILLSDTFSDKLDSVLTHKISGPIIFVAIFTFIFQSIFSWAEVPMNFIENATNSLGSLIGTHMPEGILKSLITDGVIAGVGAVLIFLPQILFLFFFLTILEDSGYMARAAFMLDRLMRGMGLSGRSVIPLLSSFACAIPGIMATRTIQNWRDRLITIMIAPFMSCSARLPVYILLIGAFVPSQKLFGIISYSTVVLLSMYLIGIVAAIAVALIFKSFLHKRMPASSFVMELPPYRRPSVRWVSLQLFERAKIFVTDAGKIILAISVILWFLASFPKSEDPEMTSAEQIQQSFAGQIGKVIEPAIEPLGFDWKIGIGLITSFAAREVMVSTLATIYNVQDGDETSVNLRTKLKNDKDPETGNPRYTLLTAISLMVFFVLACQCMATVAIVKRETNSWRWPLIMVGYMTLLAYLGSLLVYQGGLVLGWGI